jgi:hypothetical protein
VFGWLKRRQQSSAGEVPPPGPDGNAAERYEAGCDLQADGQLEEAARAFRRATELDPAHWQAHAQLGHAFCLLRRHDEALAALDAALALAPGDVAAHCNRALLLLATGDYPGGWNEFEWRWEKPELQTLRGLFRQAWWDGSPLEGRTILLFAEQGLGDAVQFVRYAPLVARLGARVALDCHPPLKGLFRNVEGVAEVLAGDEDIARYELCAPLMSLPRLLGTTLGSVPSQVPYLAAPAEHASKWRARLRDDRLNVGLVWESGTGMENAWQKSLMLDALLPLARVPGVAFYGLRANERAGESAEQCPAFGLVDYGDELQDFSDTAGLMAGLDLVISVDTVFAHLAAALGRPTWMLLPSAADWRWGEPGGQSPWYPSARLFRQPREGDWEAVVADAAAALGSFVSERR